MTAAGKELVGKLRIAKVDTEKYPQIGTRFAVEGLPTVVLFKVRVLCLIIYFMNRLLWWLLAAVLGPL